MFGFLNMKDDKDKKEIITLYDLKPEKKDKYYNKKKRFKK